jgi:hypothetical protein
MNPLENQLYEIAADTFEKICFMYLLPDVSEAPAEVGESLAMKVEFEGPFFGRLVVSAGPRLSKAITTSMLGAKDPNEAQIRDALGEVANIVGGNIFPLVAQDTVFRMKALGPCDPRDPGEGLDQPGLVRVEMALEEGCVTFWLFWVPSVALREGIDP